MLTYIHIVLISVSKIVLNNPILVSKFTTVINKVIMLAAVKCSNIHCYYFSSKGSKHTILCIICYEHVVAGLGRLLFLKPASTKSKAKLAPTEVTIIKIHSLPSFRTGLAAVNSSTNKMDTKTLLLDASKQPPGPSLPNDPLIPNLLKNQEKKIQGLSCYSIILKTQPMWWVFFPVRSSAKDLFECNWEYLILDFPSILSWRSHQCTGGREGKIPNLIAVTGNSVSDSKEAKVSLSVVSCL